MVYEFHEQCIEFNIRPLMPDYLSDDGTRITAKVFSYGFIHTYIKLIVLKNYVYFRFLFFHYNLQVCWLRINMFFLLSLNDAALVLFVVSFNMYIIYKYALSGVCVFKFPSVKSNRVLRGIDSGSDFGELSFRLPSQDTNGRSCPGCEWFWLESPCRF